MTPPPSIRSAFTPTGLLRAAINLGNPILAAADESGQACGVSVDLAAAFARLLGAELGSSNR
jgi:polar amino acid transport system substrate-binding protein